MLRGPSLAVIAILLTAGTSACGEGRAAHRTLFDGSRAAQHPVELEGVSLPVIETDVVVAGPSSDDRRRTACVAEWAHRRTAGIAVVRTTVHGESVTLLDASGTAVLACDNSGGPREGNRRWCGGAFGHLRAGNVADPRLDLLCTSAEGAPLAFAWIEPSPKARFVVVEQSAYAEAYETAGSLPVRVVTRADGDRAPPAASFQISEHTATGALLRRYELEVGVAG